MQTLFINFDFVSFVYRLLNSEKKRIQSWVKAVQNIRTIFTSQPATHVVFIICVASQLFFLHSIVALSVRPTVRPSTFPPMQHFLQKYFLLLPFLFNSHLKIMRLVGLRLVLLMMIQSVWCLAAIVIVFTLNNLS